MADDLTHFSVSAGLKNIIGNELITDDFVAVFELVKNSFDAHARKVIVRFENLRQIINVWNAITGTAHHRKFP